MKGRWSKAPNRKRAFFWDNNQRSSEAALDTVNLLASSKVIFCPRLHPFAVVKRKGPATREVSGMHPREAQQSCRAAIVLQRSSKGRTVGAAGAGARACGAAEAEPHAPSPHLCRRRARGPRLQRPERPERQGGDGPVRDEEKRKALPLRSQGSLIARASALWDPARGAGLGYLRVSKQAKGQGWWGPVAGKEEKKKINCAHH